MIKGTYTTVLDTLPKHVGLSRAEAMRLLETRQMLASPDGKAFAAVRRSMRPEGIAFDVSHSETGPSDLRVRAIRLLSVSANGCVAWIDRGDGMAPGIYAFAGGGKPRLLAALDVLRGLARTRIGPMLTGRNIGDPQGMSRYMLPLAGRVAYRSVLVESDAGVQLLGDGSLAVFSRKPMPVQTVFGNRRTASQWMVCPRGAFFTAFWRGGIAHVSDLGGSYEVSAPHVHAQAVRRRVNLESSWASPDGKFLYALERPDVRAGSVRRLVVNDEVAAEGSFTAGPDGTTYSTDGRRWAVVLRPIDSRVQGDRLLDSQGRILEAGSVRVSEALVDTDGRVAAIAGEDADGPVLSVLGRGTDRAEHIWNLSWDSGMISANKLVGPRVCRQSCSSPLP